MDIKELYNNCPNNHKIVATKHCFECNPVICRMCKHLINNNGMIDRIGGCYHSGELDSCYNKFLKGYKPKEEKTKVSIKNCTIVNCCK